MHLSELADNINGRLIGSNLNVSQFVIDGRKAQTGDCYVALKGESFDGHDFIKQSKSKGATSAIVSQVGSYELPVILVDDTAKAYGQLAAKHRLNFSIPVLALTGSCGKTTVKEMIKSILPKSALVSAGNLNNHIGAPLSLLSLNSSHSHGVFELGANHIGEISTTSNWVKPTISLITNIAGAHLEGFGSIEGVAQAKGEIFHALAKDGIAIVNLDDERVKEQAKNHHGKQFSFSVKNLIADVKATNLIKMPNGCYQWLLEYENQHVTINMQVPGQHNVANALAAATSCIAMNLSLVDIKQGLEGFTGVDGRLNIKKLRQGGLLIDDTYNANLHSVKAAIDVLSQYKGERIFILGELAEVGSALAEHYQEIGNYAKSKEIDCFYSCGSEVELASQSFGNKAQHFNNQEQLTDVVSQLLTSKTKVLVKGSRSSHMENVVESLLNNK